MSEEGPKVGPLSPVPRTVRRAGFRGVSAVAAILLFGSAAAVTAQVSPNGGEFQVNAYTTSSQDHPALSVASGAFFVVWESWGSYGSDTDGPSIQGQRFAADGAPLGDQFQVNTYTTDSQRTPAVAASASGESVVVWQSRGSFGTDTGDSIQGQRFGADGAPLGGQFQVNTYTTGNQADPAVTAGSAGGFVVVWSSEGSYGSDTDGSSIQGQRFDVDGNPAGDQFQVNAYTTDGQGLPAVAASASGESVVVWMSYGGGGTDTGGWSVQGQRFDTDGNPAGGQFQVNSYTTSSQQRPAVAASAAGGFVVVWESAGSYGSDTSSMSIQAQRYDSAGAPLGSEFQVNSYTTGFQSFPDVASDAGGDFVVVWQSPESSGPDLDGSIHAQRFDAGGEAYGGEFQVNSYTTGYQYYPVVASDPSGNFVVAWEGYGSFGTDTDSTSVHGQRFDGLFRDGLESGDTSRWSSSVP